MPQYRSDPMIVLVPASAPTTPTAAGSRLVLKRKKNERTAMLSVSVPTTLADDLKHVVTVLPGVSLDHLFTRALKRAMGRVRRKAGLAPGGAGALLRDDCVVIMAS
jgi:hypothetical protein